MTGRPATRTTSEGAQALRPALPRVGLGGRVVEAIAPAPDDVFLEIGPGRGALTLALAPRVRAAGRRGDRPRSGARRWRRGVPGERDRRRRRLPPGRRRSAARARSRVRVAGNLPYNISTPILFRLLALARRRPARQRRDAHAPARGRRPARRRARARRAGACCRRASSCGRDVEVRLALPPGAFRPAPKVHSAVVRVTYQVRSPPVAERRDVRRAGPARSSRSGGRCSSNALASFAA